MKKSGGVRSADRKAPPPPATSYGFQARSRKRKTSPPTSRRGLKPQLEPPYASIPGFSTSYSIWRGEPCSNGKKYVHKIWFKNDAFTMDGKFWRKLADDPKNEAFWESVRNTEIPDEFNEDGGHRMIIKYLGPDEEWEPPRRWSRRLECKARSRLLALHAAAGEEAAS